MKTTQKILSFIIVFAVLLTTSITAFAATSTLSPLTNKTYTHQSKHRNDAVHHGIDVSEHNQKIDWAKVAKVVDHVIIRVGYRGYGAKGSMLKDEYFDTNIKEAKKYGLKVGIYFYSQALNTNEAIEEAKNAIKWLGDNKLDLPIFYDYEFADVSTGRLDYAWKTGSINRTIMTNNAIAFLDTVHNAGYDAMIYANRSFLSDHVDHTVITKHGYGIWVAEYGTSTSFAGEYRMWQYSEYGKIDGISGNVDCNFWYGNFDYKDNVPDVFTVSPISNKAYKNGAAVKPVPEVHIRDKKLVAGADYYVLYNNNTKIGTATATVVGINDYENYASKTVEFKIAPAKPTNIRTVSYGTNNIEIEWDKSNYAQQYRVQVYRNGAWKTYKTTTKTTMDITDLTPAVRYGFRVKSFNIINDEEYASSYTSSYKEATKPVKTANLTLTSTNNSATLTWDEQKNASGYQIQQYDYETAKYTRIADIEGSANNTYKVTKLLPLTKYRFRVRAYKTAADGTKRYGYYSSYKEIYTKPSTPEISAITTPSTKKIKVSWNKINGANGYEVQWSTSSSFSYNYLSETINKGSTLTKTITTYQSNTKYYVRVRAYAVIDGNTYYSKWSSAKNIIVK